MVGRVCVIGSANMDLVVRSPRLPAPGETLLGGPFETFPGGKGANQAVAAARMGARVTMVGRVGTDAYGSELRSVLSREGVDLTALRAAAGVSTGVALITVDASTGENTIVVAGGANLRVCPEDIEAVAGLIRSADVLLMQLEVPLGVVSAAAKIAHASGRQVVLNAAPAQALPAELLALVHVLIVNASEAATLTGLPAGRDPGELAGALQRSGPRAVVVTLGRIGALLCDASGCRPVSSVEVEAVDTVGAGDAFCGALAAMLASGVPLDEAAQVGCIAGALAATKAGAIPSLPTRDAVGRLSRGEVGW
ncbi:MAG: ribokinase [Phycisphaerales bacterium]|nr:ribokinase [Phycisphaerales bacterium]